jgi:hypothetical protein
MVNWWNDSDNGQIDVLRQKSVRDTLSAVNRVCTGLGLNPLLGNKRLTTAHLNCDTALSPDEANVYYSTFKFGAHREHSPCPLQDHYVNAI